jgi:hypothetical protein
MGYVDVCLVEKTWMYFPILLICSDFSVLLARRGEKTTLYQIYCLCICIEIQGKPMK